MPVTDIKWLKTLANFSNSGSFLLFLITQANARSASVALLIIHVKSVNSVLDCYQNPVTYCHLHCSPRSNSHLDYCGYLSLDPLCFLVT